MTVSLYLKRPDASEETAIYGLIFYSGQRVKYYLPEKIHPKYWNDGKKKDAKNKADKKASIKVRVEKKVRETYTGHAEFNTRLKTTVATIERVFRAYVNDNDHKEPTPAILKELLDKRFKKGKHVNRPVTFFDYFNDFVSRSKKGERVDARTKKATVHNTNKGYKSTLTHLTNFQKKYNRRIDFETIDLEFYKDYVSHITKIVKLSHNTIGDHVKRIKAVLNEATEIGVNHNMAFRSKHFTKLREDTDSIYLTTTEISELEKLNLTENKQLEKARDLFLIGCHTGLRFSDWHKVSESRIENGFITIRQTKTGQDVVIPVHHNVKKILRKYAGQLPKMSGNDVGESIKKVGEKLDCLNVVITKSFTKGGSRVNESYKKYELLTSHTGRRSFATNQYLAGVPTITIMAVTGHKTERAFMRYIKLSSNEHAVIMMKNWNNAITSKAI
jgi:hypothetical protein